MNIHTLFLRKSSFKFNIKVLLNILKKYFEKNAMIEYQKLESYRPTKTRLMDVFY